GLGSAAGATAESRCLRARSRGCRKVHVLRAADHGRKGSGQSGRERGQRRRNQAGMRAVVSDVGDRVWRFERSGERSVEAVAIVPRKEVDGGSGHTTQSYLFAKGVLKEKPQKAQRCTRLCLLSFLRFLPVFVK